MRKITMKNTTLRGSLILSVLLLFMACKKEYSVENGVFGGVAQGELVDSLGNCKNPTVVGNYVVDTALSPATNYVIINVNFTSQGKYKIYSDTVNGMWFIDSGFTVSPGSTTIKLKGYGTPILPKITDFALLFNNTICGFAITVSGSGGTGAGTGSKGDYFPTTSGSNWEYQFLPKMGNTDKFTVTVAQQQVKVSGDPIFYSKFGTSLLDTFYFGKDGAGKYYAFSTVDFDYTFIFDSIPDKYISYVFLDENAALGSSWSSPDYGEVKLIGSNGVAEYGVAKAVFTIISKNSAPGYTIGGKTYTDVINVKREIMFKANASSTYKLVLSGNSYYAKNYGLIDQVFTVTPSQSISITKDPVIK
jgi:hypothetical protein